ncbi:hypothetical protein [Frigoribacterium sp. Leaf172]|uniref:hypothetical protein n=1 Tax=Frigoribacterium sp. Leaf172 TaxID=1736285 RepID=UPI000B182D36|nr:hypothetical protein [Frigoribacterium sp. Leaf172]
MQPEHPSPRSDETATTYVKWVDRNGYYEAHEHRTAVQLRHRQNTGGELVSFDVTAVTPWSSVTGPSATEFTFQIPGMRPVTVIAPAIAATALLSSLKRISTRSPEGSACSNHQR